MVSKKKYMYMHTINGYPARYEGKEGQICYVEQRGSFIGKLVPSLKQIRKEQKLSHAWRKEQGFDVKQSEYSYIRVELPK